MNHEEITHQRILFGLGILGIVFYVLAPVLFPGAENLRQPELLPIYSLMIGLGKLLNTGKKNKDADVERKDDKNISK